MKTMLLLLVLVLATVALGQQIPVQAHHDTQTQTDGRYQLFNAPVTETLASGLTNEEQTVFMIDTATGRVWEYVPFYLNREGKGRDEAFHEVDVFENQFDPKTGKWNRVPRFYP